ncbi:amidohydrolase [Gaeumannomyces tritici R3-111a-1]|uniref:Amidohydrolase n=1 Tax=Gaeumannomyces tritici (strain R3-111a-1) TaxID=644352 RepID=J3PAN0_GAET3|nr:amidohydrolase [Gaeumannomyces tritici R3-111a-1]EJT71296.1 amidohydrolase [Gaeumannomyces tritici R3-111a-1]
MRHFASYSALLPLLAAVADAATTILFNGGTIVAFDRQSEGLRVIRNGSLLVRDDRIAGVYDSAPTDIPTGVEIVDATDKILTPGFIDTHRHGWQTAFKTLGSNTSLVEYFGRFGEFASAGKWTAEDVYNSQLAGLYEAVNSGVTTMLDHAHHTWDRTTSNAGLRASIDSGSRAFWAFTFHNTSTTDIPALTRVFREIAQNASFEGSPTTLGISYDAWGPNPNINEVNTIMDLAKEFNVSVITTHSLQGPWGITNSPEDLHALNYLNISIPIVFSHASFLTAQGASLLRSTNQYISITPESEMHYGHTHPVSYHIQDQAALGVDTHFTFSTDILTQARIWLQQARYEAFEDVLDRWELPANNPMSVNQAFLLATRNGGLALRRDDLGVIAEGAKADIVVWDGGSPALLGWTDPVAAVMLHASVGDVESVVVDGKWVKKEGKLTVGDYKSVRAKFLQTAKRIQDIWRNTPLPSPEDMQAPFPYPIGKAKTADVKRGDGDGYGEVHI